MARIDNTIRCDGCGVEIALSPVMAGNREYCCQDCANGLRCSCAQAFEMDQQRRARSYEDDPRSIEP